MSGKSPGDKILNNRQDRMDILKDDLRQDMRDNRNHKDVLYGPDGNPLPGQPGGKEVPLHPDLKGSKGMKAALAFGWKSDVMVVSGEERFKLDFEWHKIEEDEKGKAVHADLFVLNLIGNEASPNKIRVGPSYIFYAKTKCYYALWFQYSNIRYRFCQSDGQGGEEPIPGTDYNVPIKLEGNPQHEQMHDEGSLGTVVMEDAPGLNYAKGNEVNQARKHMTVFAMEKGGMKMSELEKLTSMKIIADFWTYLICPHEGIVLGYYRWSYVITIKPNGYDVENKKPVWRTDVKAMKPK